MVADAAQVLRANGIVNESAIVAAASAAGLDLYVAAALVQKESSGWNVYGSDKDSSGNLGAMYGRGAVTETNFKNEFLPAVLGGALSNGVGPVQITYPGYFRQQPDYPWWDPYFNCLKGFQIFKQYLDSGDSLYAAASRYNSGTATGAPAYAAEFVAFAETWKTRLAGASTGGESVGYTNEKAQLATVAWLKARLGKYRYSQDLVKRLDPDKYGETDCSGLGRWMFLQLFGIEIGKNTAGQQATGVQVFGSDCETVAQAISLLQPGDQVFYDWDGVNVPAMDHVDTYIGEGMVCGHGGGPDGTTMGPTIYTLQSQWDAAHTIWARRYITPDTKIIGEEEDDMAVTAEEIAEAVWATELTIEIDGEEITNSAGLWLTWANRFALKAFNALDGVKETVKESPTALDADTVATAQAAVADLVKASTALSQLFGAKS